MAYALKRSMCGLNVVCVSSSSLCLRRLGFGDFLYQVGNSALNDELDFGDSIASVLNSNLEGLPALRYVQTVGRHVDFALRAPKSTILQSQ
jgi:hypothetical protein